MLVIPLPGMPKHVSRHHAGLSQRLHERVGAVDVRKEAVRYRGLEHTGFDDQLDCIIVARVAGVAG
jgi:hypothetical protein